MRITGGRKKIRIGDLLVEAGAITEEELQEALAYQKENGGRIGNVIMELGFISQELLITVLTTQMGIDYIELKACKLDEDLLKQVPENLVNKYKAIPIGYDENNPNILRVAMVDPMDLNAIDDIGIATNTLSSIETGNAFMTSQTLEKILEKFLSTPSKLPLFCTGI